MAVAQPSESALAGLDRQRLLWLYERMVTIRTFEERFRGLVEAGRPLGSGHLYIGQEAVAASPSEAPAAPASAKAASAPSSGGAAPESVAAHDEPAPGAPEPPATDSPLPPAVAVPSAVSAQAASAAPAGAPAEPHPGPA